MNRSAALFELGELIAHAKDLISEIEEGRYEDDGDLSYPVALSHLLDHLVKAWHFSRLANGEIDGLTQEEFIELTNAIPRFCGEETLVEMHDTVIRREP
ncbi:MAG: hypothetical protein AAGJ46_19335 [Planctomycetota bacterium]